MANKFSLQNINVLAGRRIFFDANILIYINWPTGANNWEVQYSNAYAALLRQNNELFVDYSVVSEIVNRMHRIEYEKFLTVNMLSKAEHNYKTYRNTAEGNQALLDIFTVIQHNILNSFNVVGKSFSKAEITSFLVVDTLDFVDKGTVVMCQENNCVLFTNDADFKTAVIDILSSNPAILRN